MYKLSIIGVILMLTLILPTSEKSEAQNKMILPIVRSGFNDFNSLINVYNLFDNDFVIAFSGIPILKHANKVNGEKIVSYFSATEIINNIENLKNNNISWVAYDLEKGYSPSNEVNAPIDNIKKVADVLHMNNMKLVLNIANIPDLKNVVKEGVKYADMYIMQGQYFQDTSIGGGPDVYAKKVIELAKIIRNSNPNVLIIAQVSTLKGDLQNCKESFSKVADYVDGVTLFFGTSKSELTNIKEFYTWIESNY
ncbi:MAG: hypothetical protein QW416_04030 [Candidatus Nitrosocaldaceae archaeon]